ncbi:MAG: hypothetical protein WDM86_09170 [Rhizomicrobium sp.]
MAILPFWKSNRILGFLDENTHASFFPKSDIPDYPHAVPGEWVRLRSGDIGLVLKRERDGALLTAVQSYSNLRGMSAELARPAYEGLLGATAFLLGVPIVIFLLRDYIFRAFVFLGLINSWIALILIGIGGYLALQALLTIRAYFQKYSWWKRLDRTVARYSGS